MEVNLLVKHLVVKKPPHPFLGHSLAAVTSLARASVLELLCQSQWICHAVPVHFFSNYEKFTNFTTSVHI